MARRTKRKKRLWSKSSKYKKKDGTIVEMDSTWEVAMAKRLDKLNIRWDRDESIKIHYQNEKGKNKNYIPDFYLPEFKLFIEVKGYWTDAARYKMKDVQERYPNSFLILESLEEISKVNRRLLAKTKKY